MIIYEVSIEGRPNAELTFSGNLKGRRYLVEPARVAAAVRTTYLSVVAWLFHTLERSKWYLLITTCASYGSITHDFQSKS